jgi:hypothetical protein
VSEFFAAVGRHGGKGWFAAAVVVYLACLRKHHLKRGELGRVMVMTADKDQAGETFRYVSELIDSTPILKPMVVSRSKESIELDNRIEIEVRAASFRRIRGRKVLAAICDEIALWYSDEASANPDNEILTALRPSMLGVPGALLIAISSPYARKGTLWQAYKDHYDKDSDVLVWQAPTWAMHPTADRKFLEREEQKDPISFRAEYGAEFRTDLESFVSPEVVERVVVKGRGSLPHTSGRHFAFVDPAGGSGQDSFTLAVARRDGDKAILVRLVEIRPPFSPDAATADLTAVVKEYGLTRVIGDRYAGAWPRDRLRAHGISYETADLTKSDYYQAFLPLLNGPRVELLDNQRLIAQLLALERATSRLGKDSISHPPGGHDDVINVGAGALVSLFKHRAFEGYQWPPPEPDRTPKPGTKEVLDGFTVRFGNCGNCGRQAAYSTTAEKKALESGCIACKPG